MALRNRKEVETRKLVGVNLASDPSKLDLGQFTSLQNWIPGKLLKIKKKRGVADVPPGPDFHIVNPCNPCLPDTLPEPQTLEAVHCYVYQGGVPPGTIADNDAGQLNFVGNDSFVCTVSAQNGFAASYTDSPDFQILRADDLAQTIAAITRVPLPSGYIAGFTGQSAQSGMSGHSDEPSYMFWLNNISPLYNGSSLAIGYFSIANGCTFLNFQGADITETWAKRGNRFWHLNAGSGGFVGIGRWSLSAGGGPLATHLVSVAGEHTVKALHATNNYLYALLTPQPIISPGVTTIARLDLDTMVEIDTWMPAAPFDQSLQMHVLTDDLIYLFTADTAWKFGYFKPSTNTTVLIGSITPQCTQASGLSGQQAFHYDRGYFYLSHGGAGTGIVNTLKVGPLLCPGTDTPIGR